jgi:hypothetical protein
MPSLSARLSIAASADSPSSAAANDVNPHDQSDPLHIPLTTDVIGCIPRESTINKSIERRRPKNPPEEEDRNGTFPTNGKTGGGVCGK